MYLPHIDVCEGPDDVVVLIELPGVDRRDVQISWKDNILTISGHKRPQPDAAGAKYVCVERNYGPFRREIVIGIPIDHKKAKAELREGLMKIRLPKFREEQIHNTISIE
jgi:HSP20 family protein